MVADVYFPGRSGTKVRDIAGGRIDTTLVSQFRQIGSANALWLARINYYWVVKISSFLALLFEACP